MTKCKRLGVLDAAFLTLDSRDVSAHVGILVTLSRPEDASPDFIRDLVVQLREATTFTAPFNYRLARSPLRKFPPTWDVLPDDEVDLDYHFRHSALPAPGGQSELGVLVSRLHSLPLDRRRPLWECHLIEGLSDGRFAIYVKVHHALADGINGTRRIAKMFDVDPESTRLRAVWQTEPETSERIRTRVGRRSRVRRRFQLVGGLGVAVGRILKDAIRPSDPAVAVPFRVPRMEVLNGRIGRERQFATQSYPLERVKRVATALGVTVNDVFIGICAGGLRRYLAEFHELPQKSLVAGTPVSLRRTGDGRGNAIAMLVAKLFTEVADPVDRIRLVSRSTMVAKQKFYALPQFVGDYYGVLTNGPSILQNIIGTAGRSRPPFNLVISNIPGSREPLYLHGARVLEAYPISLLAHGQALNITVISSAGQFNVGFVGCRDRLPHMQRLALYAGEALGEIEAVLGLVAPDLNESEVVH
ncbi:diacylglycerol O-acyltransferase [Nocardia rhizosphaerihabitans]|uniref:Diacylglycerol O-acyltransferase n=2 Tax=Nocardia rhizosphaerihabitans TaxID=1691570 RepID=A0ABQ2L3B1_9NOCA|nr:diacylglycerol O-acyltransferase [Nocardia rhizosphaerihabitans]